MKKKSKSLVQIDASELIALKKKISKGRGINARKTAALLTGSQRSFFKTRGMNFEEVRPYVPGDDARQIDWRVTAKQRRPYTKVYTDDSVLYVYPILDLRASMRFATRGRFKSVLAAEAVAFLSWKTLLERGVLNPTVLLNAGVKTYKPETTEESLIAFFKDLSRLTNAPDKTGEKSDLTTALNALKKNVRRGALIVIFSDFYGFSNDGVDLLKSLSLKNKIVLCHIFDPLEEKLPADVLSFVGEGANLTLDARSKKTQSDFSAQFKNLQKSLQDAAQKYRLLYIPLKTSDDGIAAVSKIWEGANDGH